MSIKTSFVDFYKNHHVLPVSQDISDIDKHYQRRESLFIKLGIMPRFLKGKSIIEFGPGSGHNSLYSASLKPYQYVLVDGNPKSIEDTKKKLKDQFLENLEIVHSLFHEFETDKTFDLVWAEGCLPGQQSPQAILLHLSKFVAPRGCLVVTTVDPISHLSEKLRRLVRFSVLEGSESMAEQVDQLVPYFVNHLSTLKGMSRSVEDWVIDNIIQPHTGMKLLTIPDVIATIGGSFEIVGSSPDFITDMRWYKEIIGDSDRFNQNAMRSYFQNNLNFIDYRQEFPIHSTDFGYELYAICGTAWNLIQEIEDHKKGFEELCLVLDEIAEMLVVPAERTSLSISEAISWLRKGAPKEMEMNHLPSWWGRGQQYINVIRVEK